MKTSLERGGALNKNKIQRFSLSNPNKGLDKNKIQRFSLSNPNKDLDKYFIVEYLLGNVYSWYDLTELMRHHNHFFCIQFHQEDYR